VREDDTMSRTSTLAATGYGTLAITDTLLAATGSPKARQLRRLTKPLLMPTLAASFAGSTSGTKNRLRRGVLAAHGCSWAGDVALLGGSERALLTGVGSFFAAHVAYLTAFTSIRRPADFNTIGLKTAAVVWVVSAPTVAIAAGRKDVQLRIPIAAYASVLATMYAASTMLDESIPTHARRLVMTGTALFLVSDLTLGVNKFLLNDEHPRLGGVVMATYTAGQGLIAIGVAKATVTSNRGGPP
jgi:uncharacterized membrane protein YhhN